MSIPAILVLVLAVLSVFYVKLIWITVGVYTGLRLWYGFQRGFDWPFSFRSVSLSRTISTPWEADISLPSKVFYTLLVVFRSVTSSIVRVLLVVGVLVLLREFIQQHIH